VGGGGGSVAAWLCERVGPAGSVVATDINTRLLEGIELPNFEARRHDITCDSLPDGEFDFVHTKWLLHHLPEPERAIRRMIGALRPGGWLLLEEVDFFPVHASPSRVYVDFMVALVNTVVSASGHDCFWARELPELVAGMDLSQVGSECDVAVLQGGSPVAEFFSLTAEQMREPILASGALSTDRLAEALTLLRAPNFWAFAGGRVAVWGQRPM
jgi:SAM-dependent methyltransferase